jgi:hypothetical protein
VPVGCRLLAAPPHFGATCGCGNVIGELKAATPLGGGNTLNGYIGAGAAIFWPSGHPTGGTTSFLGSATAPAVRIGWAWIISLVSIGRLASRSAHGSAEFETTSERFRFDHKNEVIFGLNLTYTPAGN